MLAAQPLVMELLAVSVVVYLQLKPTEQTKAAVGCEVRLNEYLGPYLSL